MNVLAAHTQAAMLYFRSGLATVLLFGVAILRQPRGRERVDRRASLAGLASVLANAAFLTYMELAGTGGGGLDPATRLAARPAVWLPATLEWAVFFSTVLWFLVLAAGQRRPPP